MSRVTEATSFNTILGRLFYWFVRRKVVKRLGKPIDPVRVMSNHPGVLWGYGQLEQVIDGPGLLDSKLKNLVSARTASLIGCLF